MEPRYEATYRASILTSLGKMYDAWKRDPGDVNILEYYIIISPRLITLALDSHQLISQNGCGGSSITRFIANLHTFVTGQWSPKTADGYQYAEEEAHSATKRFYARVPATFSPSFPIPSKKKELQLIFNEGDQRDGLMWVVINRFGYGYDQVRRLQQLTSTPQYLWDAKKEDRYFVASCTYKRGNTGSTVNYWNANGPLPSAQVQDFLKDIIREPRHECPTAYPGERQAVVMDTPTPDRRSTSDEATEEARAGES
jgi:hypothetical protein